MTLCSDCPPPDIILTDQAEQADLRITCRTAQEAGQALLHPKRLIAGVGCKRGAAADEIAAALRLVCAEHGLALQAVRQLASIDAKRDEPGLLAAAAAQGWPIEFHSAEQLNRVEGVAISGAALRAVGAKAVAEPAALLSSGGGRLLAGKRKCGNVTVAIAEIA